MAKFSKIAPKKSSYKTFNSLEIAESDTESARIVEFINNN